MTGGNVADSDGIQAVGIRNPIYIASSIRCQPFFGAEDLAFDLGLGQHREVWMCPCVGAESDAVRECAREEFLLRHWPRVVWEVTRSSAQRFGPRDDPVCPTFQGMESRVAVLVTQTFCRV